MTSSNNQIVGILWMLLHNLLISTVVVIAKFLGESGFSEAQIVFFHSFVAFVILLPFAAHFEGRAMFKTEKFKLHFVRGFLGVISLLLYFYVLKFIPLTDARALALFNPVITFIFAVIFLKELLNLKKSIALTLSLIGGYVIVNPGNVSFQMMSLLMILAMIMWSIIDLVIKNLSKTESVIKQLLYLTGLMSLFSLPFAIYSWKMPQNSLEIWLLLAIGVIFLFNSMSVFLAMRNADLTTIMPFDFSGLVFTAIISYFIFAEVMKLNTLCGSIIVFLSSLYLIYQETAFARKLNKIGEGNVQKE